MLKHPQSKFAALLSNEQLAEATRDFQAAMISTREALTDRRRTRAKHVHSLITYAQVFGYEELSSNCRRLEAAILDNADQCDAEQAVLHAITKLLAGVPCPNT